MIGMKIITKLLLVALALLLVSEFLPGVSITGFYPALITAIILGILNLLVRPILIILTLPITVLTLGLFIIVINASLFYFAASFIEGFAVASFGYAVLGSLIISFVSTLGNRFIK